MLSPCLHNVKIKCMVWFIEIRLTASRLPEHARCSAGVHNGGLICEGVVNSGVFSWPVFSTFAISNLCTKLMKIREMKVTWKLNTYAVLFTFTCLFQCLSSKISLFMSRKIKGYYILYKGYYILSSCLMLISQIFSSQESK